MPFVFAAEQHAHNPRDHHRDRPMTRDDYQGDRPMTRDDYQGDRPMTRDDYQGDREGRPYPIRVQTLLDLSYRVGATLAVALAQWTRLPWLNGRACPGSMDALALAQWTRSPWLNGRGRPGSMDALALGALVVGDRLVIFGHIPVTLASRP